MPSALIDVDYEVLPAVIDEEAAIRDGAPQLHDNVPNNITTVYKMRRRRLPEGRAARPIRSSAFASPTIA